ncbi:restriction endonuclease subunit S [Alkalibacillus salilacus]|uniref:Type I restriction enzyme S subunit n=1 Tax=Alkalibacillus salilacus TaxID=284582 RepID=A0ABT9VFJ4_9BACI|nr:restriction endonuclease subunit S [Alkalibacillus salilacus]MDQ0159744.1 type I restriction enzyme S subunit [Alkalibacillus salilacus]
MKRLRNYLHYKKTEEIWMPEIPAHWERKKVSWLFDDIGSGATPKSTELKYYNGNIPWLNTGDLNDSIIDGVEKNISSEALKDYSTLKIYPQGSLVIAMYGATIGKLGITNTFMTTNQACCVLSDFKGGNQKFVFYWFMANRPAIINLSRGGGQPNISQNLIRSLRLYLPTNEEQNKIVSFLDQKTSEIDELISDKERLIKLLKETRQAVITEAVTKGLENEKELKKSGKGWIGSIPKHWNITKIKYSTYVKGRIGWQGLRSDEFIDEGPYLVTGTDFDNGIVDWDTCYRISNDRYEEAPEIQLKENDLLITKDGSIGKVAVVKDKPEKAILNSGVFVTRCINKNYLTEFMYWVLCSDVFKEYIKYTETGSTIKHLYQATFVNFAFPLPNIQEQKMISNYLNEKVNEIESLINNEKLVIKKLKEYRQSLIYEAVTGKIDVREHPLERKEEENVN